MRIGVATTATVVVDDEAIVDFVKITVVIVEPEADVLHVRHPRVLERVVDPAVDLPAGHRQDLAERNRDGTLIVANQIMGEAFVNRKSVAVVVVEVHLANAPVKRLLPRHGDAIAASDSPARERAAREARLRLVVDPRSPVDERPVDQVVRLTPSRLETGKVSVGHPESVAVKRSRRQLLVVLIDQVAVIAEAGSARIEHQRVRALGDVDRVSTVTPAGVLRGDVEDDLGSERSTGNRPTVDSWRDLRHRAGGRRG